MQTNYSQNMDKAFPGMKFDTRPDWVESYAAEGNTGFGVCVEFGTDAEKQVKVFDGGTIAGFSLHTNKAPGGYKNTQTVNVLRKGVVAVRVDGDAGAGVAKGQPVYVIAETGYATDDDTGNTAVPGCVFHGAAFDFEGNPVAFVEIA